MSHRLFKWSTIWGFALALVAIQAFTWQGAAIESGTNLEVRFTEAAVVAQVEVIGIHRDVDSALSEPGVTAISGYVYSAVPGQVWKGIVADQITFRLGLEYCDKKLEKGESYLIFARLDSYGRLQLHSCDSAVVESEAEALLAELKAFSSQG
ncbi:hypothetical protein [Microbulbifer sp. THAF38]|uniref:hypothetical protein n=1 Tax=Microbulbifer sp. THAF38 TaxID=2587856 RepID=UPI00126948F9|nr:hypothetical protein [Microbulbifer sp. THAF38]QFT55105.1 hypothetical protein FIU95_11115 [Microbulbifer sp. THAF38]